MVFFLILMLLGLVNPACAQSSNSSLSYTAITIPDGQGGIGFDDVVYSADLHKVLVPAGHMGLLYLIDSSSYALTNIGGFSSNPVFQKGHRVGITSADEGEGIIFVADHGKHQLDAVDPSSSTIIAYATLAGEADYVRYVGADHYVWVTEPHKKQIQVFKFDGGLNASLTADSIIALSDKPESLVIDHTRGHAYINLGPQTAAIDLQSHAILSTWSNDCTKSRGDALDEQRGFLFVSCAEGKAVVFDLNNNNKEISNLITDPGPDVISYNPKLSHLYFTSPSNASLSILGVSPQGQLSLLAQAPAVKRAHCVVGDDQNNIWVCDPNHGQVLQYKDSL